MSKHPLLRKGTAPLDVGSHKIAATKLFVSLVAACLPLDFLAFGSMSSLNFGVLLAIASAPIWIFKVRAYSGAGPLCIGLVLSVIAGLVLASNSSILYDVDPTRSLSLSALVVSGAVVLPFLLWARSVVGVPHLAVLYGIGTLINVLLLTDLSTPAWWKTELSWAVVLILLGIVSTSASKLLNVSALLILVGISTLGGYRSLAGMCLVAIGIYLYVNRPRNQTKKRAVMSALILGVIGPIIAIQVFTSLLLDGLLGAAAQSRTQDQLATSGSLIAGGRQEWAASLMLFVKNPLGYGTGVIPHVEDVNVAKTGLITLGANPDSQYINQYMFGGHFKLHSLASDFWVNFGLVGLCLVTLVGLFTFRFMVESISTNRISTLQALLVVWCFWNLLFSPIDTNFMTTLFGMALLLVPRTTSIHLASPRIINPYRDNKFSTKGRDDLFNVKAPRSSRKLQLNCELARVR